jgi:hypothetical protein
MAGEGDQFLILTVAGRLYPIVGCFAFSLFDHVHAVATLVGFPLSTSGMNVVHR